VLSALPALSSTALCTDHPHSPPTCHLPSTLSLLLPTVSLRKYPSHLQVRKLSNINQASIIAVPTNELASCLPGTPPTSASSSLRLSMSQALERRRTGKMLRPRWAVTSRRKAAGKFSLIAFQILLLLSYRGLFQCSSTFPISLAENRSSKCWVYCNYKLGDDLPVSPIPKLKDFYLKKAVRWKSHHCLGSCLLFLF
jgi:hypothetical protein